jgi:flagellar assembly protein FliH
MPKVIRADQRGPAAHFNFDDIAAQAAEGVARARREAEAIIAEAVNAATAIRERAEIEGRQAAEKVVDRVLEEKVAAQFATLRPALDKGCREFALVRQQWLTEWEARVIRLATSIARRLIRRELAAVPDIPIALVREALQLAAGSTRLRLHMNPSDLDTLAPQVQRLLDQHASAATIELFVDTSISPGGCRVDTEHGSVDQQFESQLARIAEELT